MVKNYDLFRIIWKNLWVKTKRSINVRFKFIGKNYIQNVFTNFAMPWKIENIEKWRVKIFQLFISFECWQEPRKTDLTD